MDIIERVGKGCSRYAYRLSDNEVLKIAYNNIGLRQNKVETKLCSTINELGTRIYRYSEDFRCLVVEYAEPASDDDFIKHTNHDFSFMHDFVYKLIRHQELTEEETIGIFAEIIDFYKKTSSTKIIDFSKKSSWGKVTRNGKERLVVLDYGLDEKGSEEIRNGNLKLQ